MFVCGWPSQAVSPFSPFHDEGVVAPTISNTRLAKPSINFLFVLTSCAAQQQSAGRSFRRGTWRGGARAWFGLTDPPIVRCPGCDQPMEAKERTPVIERLVDIRYVCVACGMETKRTIAEAH